MNETKKEKKQTIFENSRIIVFFLVIFVFAVLSIYIRLSFLPKIENTYIQKSANNTAFINSDDYSDLKVKIGEYIPLDLEDVPLPIKEKVNGFKAGVYYNYDYLIVVSPPYTEYVVNHVRYEKPELKVIVDEIKNESPNGVVTYGRIPISKSIEIGLYNKDGKYIIH